MILPGLRKTQLSFLVVQPLGNAIGTFHKKVVPFHIMPFAEHVNVPGKSQYPFLSVNIPPQGEVGDWFFENG